MPNETNEKNLIIDGDYVNAVGFSMVNHLLTLCPVSDGAYRTYVLLLCLSQNKRKMWWRRDRLAILRHKSVRSLRVELAELEAMHLIERQNENSSSSVIRLAPLAQVFAEFQAQTASAALWGRIEADVDLQAAIASIASAFHNAGAAESCTPPELAMQNPAPPMQNPAPIRIITEEEQPEQKQSLVEDGVPSSTADAPDEPDQALPPAENQEPVETEQTEDKASLNPDTPEARKAFARLAATASAQGRRGPRRFPTLECKRRFDDAAGKLNGSFDDTLEAALLAGITAVPRLTAYIAKVADKNTGTGKARVIHLKG